MQLCGGLRLQLGGRVVTEDDLPGDRAVLLLAFLGLHRGRAVTRQDLAAAVWPEDAAAGAGALRTLVYRVRKLLGDEVVRGRSAVELVLGPGAAVDVEDAEAAVREARRAEQEGRWHDAVAAAARATAVLERPLLASHDATWLAERRQALDSELEDALGIGVRCALAVGPEGATSAERAARALIAIAPYREAAWTGLMEALRLQGDAPEALRVFDQLRRRLREDLGTVPGAAARALHAELLAGEPLAQPTAPQRSSARPALPRWLADTGQTLHGRHAEMRAIDRAVAAARDRSRQVLVVLEGEPGIGKSRLAAEAARRAHEDGWDVVGCRFPREGLLGFQPLVDAARAMLEVAPPEAVQALARQGGPGLAGLLPELGRGDRAATPRTADPEVELHQALSGLAGFCAACAGDRPLVLVLDDLHWASPAALQLVGRIVTWPQPAPVVVLATTRNTDVVAAERQQTVLLDVARDGALERVAVDGLDAEAVADLAEALGAPRSLGSAVHARTAGNALFVVELTRHLLDQVHPSTAPRLVQDVLADRLGALGPGARELLVAAAVLGEEWALDAARDVAGQAHEEALAGLEEAMAAGLVLELGGAEGRDHRFAHALLRDVLYEGLTGARRRHLHERAASAVGAGGGSSLVAHHVLASGGGDGLGPHAEQLVRAGGAALSLSAYGEALATFRELLTAPDGSVDRIEVRLGLGEALQGAGDRRRARAEFLHAAELAAERGDASRLARAALGVAGRLVVGEAGIVDHEARTLLHRAVDALAGEPGGRALRALTLARLAAESRDAPDGAALGRLVAAQALEEARAVGDPGTVARALNATRQLQGLDRAGQGLRARTVHEMLAAADEAADPEMQWQARFWQAVEATFGGDGSAVDRHLAGLAGIASQIGAPGFRWELRCLQAGRALDQGDLEAAERLSVEAWELGTSLGVSGNLDVFHLGQMFWIRVEQGRGAEVRDAIRRQAERHRVLAVWSCAEAQIAVQAGDHDEALAVLRAAMEQPQHPAFALMAAAMAAEVAAALGSPARDLADDLEARLRPSAGAFALLPYPLGHTTAVDHALARVALLRGDTAAAADLLTSALAAYERLGAAGPLAHVRAELALACEHGCPG